MSENTQREDATDAAAVQGGNRAASITPQGAALNQAPDRQDRVPRSAGHTGQVWGQHALPSDPDQSGGYMHPDPAARPGDNNHHGGDPMTDGNSQYGASPIRTARYDDVHRVNEDIAKGRYRSGKSGAQARYPKPEDIS